MFPGQPRRKLLLAGGALAGAAMVGGIVAVKEVLDDDLEPTGAPVKVDRMPPASTTFDGQTSTAWTDARGMVAQSRSPGVLGSVENLKLTPDPFWVECHLVPNQAYRVRALVHGGNNTADNAVVVQLSGASSSVGVQVSQALGTHLTLRSGPGPHWTDHVFTVSHTVTKYGFLIPADRGSAIVKTFAVEAVGAPAGPVDFFLSFDVEADVSRAPSNHIDRLVWGKTPNGEYGIRRLVSILDEHKLKANFMVDFGTCLREGPVQMHAIGDFLAGSGHEVHMHLHTEDLTRRLGIVRDNDYRLERLNYDMGRRMLGYTIDRYNEYVGGTSRVFRSGAYLMNGALVVAAGSVGIKVLTNVREGALDSPGIAGDPHRFPDPFVWENGVVEIPVDVSSPEVSPHFLNTYKLAMQRKVSERTFNIVMHSWSLIRRNDKGVHDVFGPELEQALHRICEHVKQNGAARGYTEYAERQPSTPRPVVPTIFIRPEGAAAANADGTLRCNICDMSFTKTAVADGICPGCGSNARHRQLKSALFTYADPIAGSDVLALDADRLRLLGLLKQAKAIQDLAADNAAATKAFQVGTFGCVVGLQLVKARASADAVVPEMARVLRPGGVFISSISYRGADSQLPLQDYLDILAKHFAVSSVPAYDPVTDTASRIFFATKEIG